MAQWWILVPRHQESAETTEVRNGSDRGMKVLSRIAISELAFCDRIRNRVRTVAVHVGKEDKNKMGRHESKRCSEARGVVWLGESTEG